MKKIIIIGLIAILSLGLVSCGKTQTPLTEAEQAEKYGLSLEEYKEQKDAAARMNMTIEDHLKMGHGSDSMDHSKMDMSDDSHMIEDDSEMMDHDTMTEDEEKHMKMMHEGEDVEVHGSDEHGKKDTGEEIKEFEMESFTEIIDGAYYPQFSVKEMKVKKGDRVKVIINTTKGTHDFKIDELGVYSETPTGEVTTVEFIADKVGEFVYWCTKPNHRENGHWGTLIVEE